MLAKIRALLRDKAGATTIEYGFILAVIVLVMMVALVSLADVTIRIWNDMAVKVTATNNS